jgi:hypothetical protein
VGENAGNGKLDWSVVLRRLLIVEFVPTDNWPDCCALTRLRGNV